MRPFSGSVAGGEVKIIPIDWRGAHEIGLGIRPTGSGVGVVHLTLDNLLQAGITPTWQAVSNLSSVVSNNPQFTGLELPVTAIRVSNGDAGGTVVFNGVPSKNKPNRGGGGGGTTTTTWWPGTTSLTLSNGNLTVFNGTGTHATTRASAGASTGKKYFEVRSDTADLGPGDFIPGICQLGFNANSYLGSDAFGWGWQVGSSRVWNNAGQVAYGTGSSAAGIIIGVLFDIDAGTIRFTIGGVDQGAAFTGLGAGTYYPGINVRSLTTATARFNRRDWTYTPPAGYEMW